MKPPKSPLAEDFPPAPFTGFKPGALKFFEQLAENQNKAWFDAHKSVYETEIKAPLASLIAELTARLAEKKLVFCADPRRAIFRLHRDVRFSHDKSPYKTNAGAAMTRTGAKDSPGVLYLHLDPLGCFAAAGFYVPEPETLAAMRAALIHHPARWQAMCKALKKRGLALDRENALTRPPKGYEPVPEAVREDIKLKSWVVRRGLSLEQISGAGLVEELASFALEAAPLLRFGWAAVG